MVPSHPSPRGRCAAPTASCWSRRSCYPTALLIAHGSGLHAFTIAAMAIAMGDHVRIGFEDSPRLPTNAMPRSNADLVEWAVTVARLHGREPATPSQARALLRLPQHSA